MLTRLNVRNRPGRLTRVGRGAGGGGGGGSTEFFGVITMLREFWAEDPDYLDPGDGGAIGSIRDNGTLGESLIAVTANPVYRATALVGKPCYDFSTNDGRLRSTTTSVAAPFSVGCVIQKTTTSHSVFIDSGASPSRAYVEDTGTQWRFYNATAIDAQGGTSDTDVHLLIARFVDGDCSLSVDGVVVATDAGSVTAPVGLTLGANFAGSSTAPAEALMGYAFMYDGDIAAHPDFASFKAAIGTHYGITVS